jgi:hypothetical protein
MCFSFGIPAPLVRKKEGKEREEHERKKRNI